MACTNLALTQDANCIAISSLDSVIRLIDLSTGQLLAKYTGHVSKDMRGCVGVSHDDMVVAGASECGNVFIWDLVEGNVVRKLGHSKSKAQITSLALHPQKNEDISGASDGTVKVWA